MHVEENCDINHWGTLNFFCGIYSFLQMHFLLYETSPQHDEHMTMREVGVSYFTNYSQQIASGKYDDGRKIVPI